MPLTSSTAPAAHVEHRPIRSTLSLLATAGWEHPPCDAPRVLWRWRSDGQTTFLPLRPHALKRCAWRTSSVEWGREGDGAGALRLLGASTPGTSRGTEGCRGKEPRVCRAETRGVGRWAEMVKGWRHCVDATGTHEKKQGTRKKETNQLTQAGRHARRRSRYHPLPSPHRKRSCLPTSWESGRPGKYVFGGDVRSSVSNLNRVHTCT